MEDDEGKGVTPAELGALGVGLSVTIASVVMTGVALIPFPFNLLISLALGGTAGYGTLKVLDPRTRQEVIEAKTNAEYQQMLQEIGGIAVRIGDTSQSLRPASSEVSERLDHIHRMTVMILDRYQERPRDYAGVSAMLLILQRFEEILSHYRKVKRSELFLDEDRAEKVIIETETQVIPMFEAALESLGKKLDSGKSLDTGISKGTLESMLQSLNLIESLSDQMASSSKQGDPR